MSIWRHDQDELSIKLLRRLKTDKKFQNLEAENQPHFMIKKLQLL